MADGDNEVRIAMRSSDREVEDRIAAITAQMEALKEKQRDVARASRQAAQESKQDFEETGRTFDALGKKAAAMGASLLAAFSVGQLKAFREELIKIGEEQAKLVQDREKGILEVGRGAGLSAEGQRELRAVVAGGRSALSDQERVGLFGAIAGEVRPTSREDERAALQIQSLLQRQGDALSAGELERIGSGAGSLYRLGGVGGEAAVGMATLAMQRQGSQELVRQSGKLAGALAASTPEMDAETRAATLLAAGEQLDRAGVEAGSLKGVLQRIEKSRSQGGAFTFTDMEGKTQRAALPLLTQGSTFDAFLGLVGAAQGGDRAAQLAAQQLLGEQGGAILGGFDLRGFEAGRAAYLGAGRGTLEELQASAMGNVQVARDVEQRRADNARMASQTARNADANRYQLEMSRMLEERDAGVVEEKVYRWFYGAQRLYRPTDAVADQVVEDVRWDRMRRGGEAFRSTGGADPFAVNVNVTLVQDGDGAVVDYSGALDGTRE